LAASARPARPSIASEGGAVVVGAPGPDARFLAVYRRTGGAYVLDRVYGADVGGFTLTSGEWAASSIARGGAESLAVPLSVP
jgi:CBS domain-containing protein